MPFENLTANNLEAALRLSLRGCRLIFEIGLSEELYDSASKTFRNSPGDLHFDTRAVRHYPATLAVFLSAGGALHYREGVLWPNLGVEGPKGSFVGQSFLQSLRFLGLESFEAVVEGEHALRYLTPILAHGGIPRYCLSDFFRLLIRAVRQGSTEPLEILSLWRTRPSLTQGMDKPAIRFLLHGGEPAVDFLQRCIDLVLETRRNGYIPGAAELGLPQSLVESFAAFENEVRQTLARDGLPRPYVQLDPWDGLGPTLELPPAEARSVQFSWHFRDDRHQVTFQGSRSRAQTIRLNPARAWEVEARVVGSEPRPFVFECFNPLQVLFFDPASRRLWRGRDQLRLGSVWALYGPELVLTCIDEAGTERDLIRLEELPPPSGPWTGCRLAHFSLHGAKYLLLKPEVWEAKRIPVVVPGARPTLADETVVQGVRSLDGATIHAGCPLLRLPEIPDVPWERWRIAARSNGETRNVTARELGRDEEGFSIEGLLRGWRLRDVDLAVRGPLGSDLSVSFAIVPGLSVERPDRVLLPTEPAQVRLNADVGVKLGESSCITLPVPLSSDHVRCSAHSREGDLDLVISVPRLRWGLMRGDGVGMAFATNDVVVDAAEISDVGEISIVVSTGAPGIRARLRLIADGQMVQSSDWAQASATARLFFGLARFRDTILHRGISNPEFVLDFGKTEVRIGRVVTRLETKNISARRIAEGERLGVECRFDDDRAMLNREVRFWSQDRPWENPVIVPVPDGVTGAVTIEGPRTPPAGRYVVQVAISDPWNRAARPSAKAANCALITLGEPDDVECHRRHLNPEDPLDVVESAISTGRAPRLLSDFEGREVAGQCVEAACCLLRDLGASALYARALDFLQHVFASDLRMLGWSVYRAIERGCVSQTDLLRLAIAVVPTMSGVEEIDNQGPPGLSDSMLRDIWSACPPIAALFDIPRAARGEPESVDRCESIIGVRPGASVEPGEPISAQEWHSPAEVLRMAHSAMELKPARLLALDALAEANFEWLLAEREGRLDSRAWCLEHHFPPRHLLELGEAINVHLASRKSRGTEDGMKLPRRVLGAAIQVASNGPDLGVAARALLPLVDATPRLVTRDLTLAIFLVHAHPAPRGPSGSGTDAEPS